MVKSRLIEPLPLLQSYTFEHPFFFFFFFVMNIGEANCANDVKLIFFSFFINPYPRD